MRTTAVVVVALAATAATGAVMVWRRRRVAPAIAVPLVQGVRARPAVEPERQAVDLDARVTFPAPPPKMFDPATGTLTRAAPVMVGRGAPPPAKLPAVADTPPIVALPPLKLLSSTGENLPPLGFVRPLVGPSLPPPVSPIKVLKDLAAPNLTPPRVSVLAPRVIAQLGDKVQAVVGRASAPALSGGRVLSLPKMPLGKKGGAGLWSGLDDV